MELDKYAHVTNFDDINPEECRVQLCEQKSWGTRMRNLIAAVLRLSCGPVQAATKKLTKVALISFLIGAAYIPSVCLSAERFTAPIVVGDSWSNDQEDWMNYTTTVGWGDYKHHGIAGEWISARNLEENWGFVLNIVDYLDQHPNADSIIIQGGINDIANYVPAATIITALQFIASEAKARNNIVDIIVMAPGPWGDLVGTSRQSQLETYLNWLPGFCEAQAITCYDAYTAVGHYSDPTKISDGTDGSPDYSEDGLHLNLEGSAKVAADLDLLIEAIRRSPVQLTIDVDPWNNANKVFPVSDLLISVAIMGSNTASGDAVDFDATQINPASLKLGLGEAQNVAIPWVVNIDSDSNTDMIFGFWTQDTGIFCDDEEVTIVGETYAGESFTGTDTIDASDCITVNCHP
jgi:lysophospholipase L1-like esterase